MDMQGAAADPRIMFPEIATGKANDPRITSCQGEAQEQTPQLAMANFMAAGLAQQLFYYHALSGKPELVPREMHPVYFASSLYGFQSRTPKQAQELMEAANA
jgi:hypothetical protein